MDAVLLIADNDGCRRHELRRFFRESGFLTMAVADGLQCITALRSLQPDVLVIAAEIPWGGADGVVARLKEELPAYRRPSIILIGDTPAEMLSSRTGVARCNCFAASVRREELLDRIGLLMAAGLLRIAQHWLPLPSRPAPPRPARRRTGVSAARQWRPAKIGAATGRIEDSLRRSSHEILTAPSASQAAAQRVK